MSATQPLAASANPAAQPRRPELSVVVPVHDEADNLPLLVERLKSVLDGCVASWEIVCVDDGSRDGTLSVLRLLHEADPRINAISFSRNFGKEIAIAAGLDHASGDAVVIMDADLQHPPETIPVFLAKWRDGFLNVYGQRTDREGEGRLKRGFAKAFYKLFASFGETELPEGAGDFRL
ncbi:MAG: glycosyltransferase family 2 protein, partial [Bosea sp.]|nr:glycosyltransferase family 2 protein [Bosea sp. (in: a-proteobacteria)]